MQMYDTSALNALHERNAVSYDSKFTFKIMAVAP